MDGPADTQLTFSSLETFLAWWAQKPHPHDADRIAQIAGWGAQNGIHIPFIGHVPPEDLSMPDTNYRESYVARGLNARQRALLKALSDHIGGYMHARIYAHEAFTPLAMVLRGSFPFFLGSEYAPDPQDQTRIFPVQHADAADTKLPDDAFDAVISSDVIEHVPDVEALLRETARILKPGGVLLATFPFNAAGQATIQKARLVNGEIEFIGEPEYHGDPVKPEGGVPVFSIPGWDILDKAKAAGFHEAEIVIDSSAARGVVAGDLLGISYLRCRMEPPPAPVVEEPPPAEAAQTPEFMASIVAPAEPAPEPEPPPVAEAAADEITPSLVNPPKAPSGLWARVQDARAWALHAPLSRPPIAAFIVGCMAIAGMVINLAIPGFFSHDELEIWDRMRDYGPTPWPPWEYFSTQAFYRPFGYSIFQWIMGYGDNPMVAHGAMVLMHCVNCTLLFFLVRPRGLAAAYLAAAFYAISPLAAFSIGWTASIYDVMVVMWLLAGLLCAHRWVRGGSPVWLGGLALAVLAGFFTKETWIILAPCIAVFLVLARDRKEMIRIGIVVGATALVAALYLFGRADALGALGGAEGGPYSASPSNIPKNLALYVAFPFYLDAPEIAGVRGWNMFAALAILAHLAFLVAAIFSRNWRMWLACGLWYGLYLGPTLIIGQASTHYLYGAGAALSALLGVLAASRQAPWIARPVALIAGALLAYHAIGMQWSLYETGRCQTRVLTSLAILAPDGPPAGFTADGPKATISWQYDSQWWVAARVLASNEYSKGPRGRFVYQHDQAGADFYLRPDCIVERAPAS